MCPGLPRGRVCRSRSGSRENGEVGKRDQRPLVDHGPQGSAARWPGPPQPRQRRGGDQDQYHVPAQVRRHERIHPASVVDQRARALDDEVVQLEPGTRGDQPTNRYCARRATARLTTWLLAAAVPFGLRRNPVPWRRANLVPDTTRITWKHNLLTGIVVRAPVQRQEDRGWPCGI
jgi:hypothetical protein